MRLSACHPVASGSATNHSCAFHFPMYFGGKEEPVQSRTAAMGLCIKQFPAPVGVLKPGIRAKMAGRSIIMEEGIKVA